MKCQVCGNGPVQQLRGYWQDLPGESPNKLRFAPPDVVETKFWAAALVVLGGVWVATSTLLFGLLIALGGLLWGAYMAGQVKLYQTRLAEYDASKICLVEYHTFVPIPVLEAGL